MCPHKVAVTVFEWKCTVVSGIFWYCGGQKLFWVLLSLFIGWPSDYKEVSAKECPIQKRENFRHLTLVDRLLLLLPMVKTWFTNSCFQCGWNLVQCLKPSPPISSHPCAIPKFSPNAMMHIFAFALCHQLWAKLIIFPSTYLQNGIILARWQRLIPPWRIFFFANVFFAKLHFPDLARFHHTDPSPTENKALHYESYILCFLFTLFFSHWLVRLRSENKITL